MYFPPFFITQPYCKHFHFLYTNSTALPMHPTMHLWISEFAHHYQKYFCCFKLILKTSKRFSNILIYYYDFSKIYRLDLSIFNKYLYHSFQLPNVVISCTDGSSLLDLTEDSVCNLLNETLLSLTIVFSLIGILTIVFAILLIYFQDYVKIWLYNHKLMLFLSREADLDRDKIYDAFVSYSHKDEEFVVKNLVPELENGPEKYKLCLHERDWIIGEYIPKQISDSVQNSRRTIIVLSKNFLESDWATMEFKTAHLKSIREEKNRIIIILYEDIDVNDICDEELKVYLSTKTYIKWGDPWFWKKMRQCMPSRKTRKIGARNKYRSKIDDIEKCVDT